MRSLLARLSRNLRFFPPIWRQCGVIVELAGKLKFKSDERSWQREVLIICAATSPPSRHKGVTALRDEPCSPTQTIRILALPPESEWDPLNSIAFNACRSIVDESKQDLFYIYEDGLHSEPSFEHFNQQLHEASIKTILISHHSYLTNAVNTDHGKNIIFILKDVRELMSLILYTVSKSRILEENGENTTSVKYDKMRIEHQSKGILPLYCVTVDGRSFWSQGERTCSKQLRLSSAELEPDSILSDRVFNVTRGLYINKIWNSKNYLVFILKNFDPIHKHPAYTTLRETGNGTQKYPVSIDPVARLVFCFKFFWRFFKGLKSVICHSQGCERYDPFTEKLISTEGETDRYFIDFSWSDMHRKSVSIFFTDGKNHNSTVFESSSSNILVETYETVFNDLKRAVNCSLKYPSFTIYMGDQFNSYGTEAGLKFDIDLQPFDYGLSLEGNDYSSKRVLYPEIDSLKALEESDLHIQISFDDVSTEKEMFSQQNHSEVLGAKLVSDLYDYSVAEIGELFHNSFSKEDESSADFNFTKNRIREIEKNIMSMVSMDAMMISVPFSSNHKENVRINHHAFHVDLEYHLMQECLITYPVMIPFLKYSFLYDKLNRIIYQNLETGHTRKMMERFDSNFMVYSFEGTDAEGGEPKPYNLNDLQSAFIGLIFGLFRIPGFSAQRGAHLDAIITTINASHSTNTKGLDIIEEIDNIETGKKAQRAQVRNPNPQHSHDEGGTRGGGGTRGRR
ncbi:unnamed protein product [Bemisia tabaci]|uniref:Uncharacterized protein n=1 Tax=Bemisia tabaci TaxID=7038 RepID=A0A9P0ANB1_BEMTA|nr:unnamed protein product [Bemisia tabaci]